MKNVLKRTTLIVRDAERSLAFYRDVLGMTVWYDDEIVLSGRGLAAGGPGQAWAAGRTTARIYGLPLIDDGDPATGAAEHPHRIVDRGSHEDLLERSGLYREIAEHGLTDTAFLQSDLEERDEMARL